MQLMSFSVLVKRLAFFAVLCVFSVSAHPLDTWHTRHSGARYGDLLGVTYGNGTFVAVGPEGTVLTSAIGENWNPQVSGTTESLQDVTFGDGRFLAVGESGTIVTSPDGTNWTSCISGVTTNLGSVVFADGLFVAVGRHLSLTSPDGVSWASHEHDFDADYMTLVYGDGLFVMPGQRDSIFLSADGSNWVERVLPTERGVSAMGYGAGLFVLIDKYKNGFVSRDANEWVAVGVVPVVRAAAVVHGHGYFVTVGAGSAAYSQDGHGWRTAPVVLTPRDACFGNGTFVAVGFGETIVQSNPVFWLHSKVGGVVEIFGPVGNTFGVEAANSLGAAQEWAILTNLTLLTSPQTWSDPEKASHPNRFYRAFMQSE